MASIACMQIGKAGITENFIKTLKNNFKYHENVKISVLKSGGHNKKIVRNYSEQLLEALGDRFTAKIIGFTICIKKWRKPQKRIKPL